MRVVLSVKTDHDSALACMAGTDRSESFLNESAAGSSDKIKRLQKPQTVFTTNRVVMMLNCVVSCDALELFKV